MPVKPLEIQRSNMPCESCALMVLIVNDNKKGTLMVVREFIRVSQNFVIAIYSA